MYFLRIWKGGVSNSGLIELEVGVIPNGRLIINGKEYRWLNSSVAPIMVLRAEER